MRVNCFTLQPFGVILGPEGYQCLTNKNSLISSIRPGKVIKHMAANIEVSRALLYLYTGPSMVTGHDTRPSGVHNMYFTLQ